MGKVNGKSEAQNAELDLDHELPAGAGDGDDPQRPVSGESTGLESELQKVKAERDALLDRLARIAGGIR